MNRIRFQALDGDKVVAQTEWLPESTRECAPNALDAFRKQHPSNYAYRIERTGDSKVPNLVTMYRYRIKNGEDLYYSKLFTEAEKDAGLAAIREMYPKAQISEGVA
jgi:hypothetical protein